MPLIARDAICFFRGIWFHLNSIEFPASFLPSFASPLDRIFTKFKTTQGALRNNRISSRLRRNQFIRERANERSQRRSSGRGARLQILKFIVWAGLPVSVPSIQTHYADSQGSNGIETGHIVHATWPLAIIHAQQGLHLTAKIPDRGYRLNGGHNRG